MRYEYLHWLVASAAAVPLQQSDVYPSIQFGSGGKFSIPVFSDLHLGEPTNIDKGPEVDHKTIDVMSSVLDNEKPNMAVLNGDMISCEWVAAKDVPGLIDQIAAPLVDRDIPFAATFGNHDMSQTCSTRAMFEHMATIKGKNNQRLSFTDSQADGAYKEVGTSNYFVLVESSDGSHKIALVLYFFDSKGGPEFDTGKPVQKIVDDKVITWFQNAREYIHAHEGRVVPSLAFVHIPVHVARAMQDSFDEATAPDLKDEMIDHQDAKNCDKHGNCNYAGLDEPFMKALVETDGLMAVFSGHDHGIEYVLIFKTKDNLLTCFIWCAKWSQDLSNKPANGKGLNLCFNRHTGYGGYSNWARGARQIVIDESRLGNKDIDTWIRLEDGSISGNITLNSTFGKGQYPPVREWETWLHSS